MNKKPAVSDAEKLIDALIHKHYHDVDEAELNALLKLRMFIGRAETVLNAIDNLSGIANNFAERGL